MCKTAEFTLVLSSDHDEGLLREKKDVFFSKKSIMPPVQMKSLHLPTTSEVNKEKSISNSNITKCLVYLLLTKVWGFARLQFHSSSCICEKLWGSLVESAEDGNFSNLVEKFGNGVLMVENSFAVHNCREPQDLQVHTGGILILVFEVVVVQKILKRNIILGSVVGF